MLSSHVLEEVERVCDHVVALAEGKLIAQGSMAELAGASGGIEMELVEIDDRPTSIDDVAAQLVAAGAGVRRNGSDVVGGRAGRRRTVRSGRPQCGPMPVPDCDASGSIAEPSTTSSADDWDGADDDPRVSGAQA